MSVVWISHACPTVPFKFQIINMCNNRDAFKEGLKMPHPKIVFMHSRMTVCQSVLSVRTPSPTHTHLVILITIVPVCLDLQFWPIYWRLSLSGFLKTGRKSKHIVEDGS